MDGKDGNTDSHSQTSKPHDIVELQVGERRFTTTRTTLLNGSTFFEALLSSRWNNAQKGPYFIDADPDIFEHILRFLRRGVFPLFFDIAKGHDYPMYYALLEEAKYFGVDALIEWLSNKGYVKMVRVEEELVERLDCLSNGILGERMDPGVHVQYHLYCGMRKVYVCPRGIEGHRGNPRACGRRCMNAAQDGPAEYEDEPDPRFAAIRTKVDITPP
ncbi:BTB/POZ protein [Aspergillus aurantiobrunneus]